MASGHGNSGTGVVFLTQQLRGLSGKAGGEIGAGFVWTESIAMVAFLPDLHGSGLPNAQPLRSSIGSGSQ